MELSSITGIDGARTLAARAGRELLRRPPGLGSPRAAGTASWMTAVGHPVAARAGKVEPHLRPRARRGSTVAAGSDAVQVKEPCLLRALIIGRRPPPRRPPVASRGAGGPVRPSPVPPPDTALR